MPVAAAAAIVGAGISLYKVISSGVKEKRARREAEATRLPFYKIQDKYYQNANLAGQMAQGGFTQSAKDLYTSEAERGFGSGVQGILSAGGTANDIAKLSDSFNRSLFNLSAADAQAQMQNIQYFMKQNAELADQKTIQFLVNEKQPYENKLAEISQRRAAEQQNINQGLSEFTGSIAALGTSLQNKNLYGNGSQQTSSNFRPDPYGGQITPISSNDINQSFLTERTIPAFNNINTTSNAFRTSEISNTDDLLSGLDDADKMKLIGTILNIR